MNGTRFGVPCGADVYAELQGGIVPKNIKCSGLNNWSGVLSSFIVRL